MHQQLSSTKKADAQLAKDNSDIDLSPEDTDDDENGSTIPSTVWFLGCMMLLANTSFVMVYSLSGLYMKNVMGASMIWIGLFEGISEGASFAMKLLSGVISDYFRRRKFIMVIGYFMTVISRPILAISEGFFAVFSSKVLERIGNGVQATPRDALVSDVAPKKRKGECFGLMRSLATAGSLLGGFLGYLAMSATSDNYQHVFWLATIPSGIAMIILILKVKEPKWLIEESKAPVVEVPIIDKKKEKHKVRRHPIRLADLPRLGRSYWMLMGIVALYTLGRIGESFLALHANQNFGLPERYAPTIMILMNLTYSLSSYPMGKLSDRMDKMKRYLLLCASIGMLIFADIVLANANSLSMCLFGVTLWGAQMGMTLNIFMGFIAEMAPKDIRGTAFGFFYLISAVATVIAGTIGGTIANHYEISTAYMYSGTIATLALCAALFLVPRKEKSFAVN